MKSIFAATTLLVFIAPGLATAQLSGTYTVGGASPYFATPQEAADSLMAFGVSGPVEILIRPGVYESGTDGDGPVLFIDREIPGSDRTNRVTFTADRSAGGDTSNVILQRRVGGTVVALMTTSGQQAMSNITLEGFATVVLDTVAAVNELDPVVNLSGAFRAKQSSDIKIIGLKIDGGGRRAAAGIRAAECSTDITLEGNYIIHAAHAVALRCNSAHRFRFTNNRIEDTGYRRGGANPAIPTIVNLAIPLAQEPVVMDNVVDMTGRCGSYIISVVASSNAQSRNLRVERNRIINYTCGGGTWLTTGGAIRVDNTAGYAVIANNMVSVGTPASLNGQGGPAMNLSPATDSMLVAYNTVYAWRNTSGPNVVVSDGANAHILNNIFVSENKTALIASGSFTRDYNILSNGTDLGPNSRIATPDFVDPVRDLHLAECAIEDSSLRGIAQPGVQVDFDSESRDPLFPFIGADEPSELPPPVFEGPTVSIGGSGPRLIAAGDLDDDGDLDVVITNPGSFGGGLGDNDITILRNDGGGVFVAPEHLPMGNDPDPVHIALINNDDVPDVITSGRDGIWVRYGTGGGVLSAPEVLNGLEGFDPSMFSTTDLELADVDGDGDLDVFGLDDSSTDTAFVRFIDNRGGTVFLSTSVFRISKDVSDFEFVDLDQDGWLDLVAVDAISTGHLFTLRNQGVDGNGDLLGFDEPVAYPFSVASAPSTSTFVVGDFDRDSDVDIVLRSLGRDELVLIRNNGDGTLAEPEPFKPHRRGVPETVAALDYERDGDLDLVSASNLDVVDLLLNNGQGSFERVALCADGKLSGFPLALVTGPLDGDASTDVGVLVLGSDLITGSVEVLHNLEWMPSGVGVDEPQALPSEQPQLHANYPNPFSSVTTVRYTLAKSSPVQLTVFDLLGRRVTTVLDEIQTAGDHKVQFDAAGLASGVYLYRISAGPFVETRRMVVVK